MTMQSEKSKPVAVITGSTEGIGRAIAEAFGASGYHIVVNGRDESRTQEVGEELRAGGADVTAVAGNVADPDVAAALASTHDRLDVFVNNAGISPRSNGRRTPALEMTREEWDQVMEVNLNAPWYLSVLAGRRMAAQGSGVIIFMSSVTARAYFETSGSHYSTSKTALVGLTRALAGELAPLGVRVCGIAPGRIMTNMARTLDPAIGDSLMGMIPLNRSGTPEDIAQAALFLAGSAADYITGVTLDVNGGVWMN